MQKLGFKSQRPQTSYTNLSQISFNTIDVAEIDADTVAS